MIPLEFPRCFLYRSLAAALLVLAAACSSGRSELNVLLITLDTQRADYISVYNPGESKTPRIDALAENGVVFENAFTPIPITLPAHAALFYSRPPHSLNIYNNGQVFQPSAGSVSLAEVFSGRGYATAAFTSLGVLQKRFGLDRGFIEYLDEPHAHRWYLDADEINQRVFAWMDRRAPDPFFLWIHYSDPHDPYAPPGLPPDLRILLNGELHSELCVRRRENLSMRFRLQPGENVIRLESLSPFPVPRDDTRFSFNDIVFTLPEGSRMRLHDLTLLSRRDAQVLALKDTGEIRILNPGGPAWLKIEAQANINLFPSESVNGYREETEFLDGAIGRLLDRLERDGLLKNTLILLVGDHGEGLGEYSDSRGEAHFGHVHYLQDIYVRIPLIFIDPENPGKDRRRSRPASLPDVAPTILKRLGWRVPDPWSGRDLFDEPGEASPPLFFETFAPEAAFHGFALLTARWRLIFYPAKREFILYDRRVDPEETRNVFREYSELPEIGDLTRELTRRAADVLEHKTDIPLDEKSREMLKSLGYIR